MMLTLLLYAYSQGLRSSRRIEACCHTDAGYRFICGTGPLPDHATIARFLVDHQEAIHGTFVEAVRLCAAAGLVSVATIAIDGTKIAADAALDMNRGKDWIKAEVERVLAEAMATDQAEQAEAEFLDLDVFSAGHLPAELATQDRRLARLRAAWAQIEAGQKAAQEQAQEHAAKAHAAAAEGHRLPGARPTEPHAALARAQADYAAAQAQAQAQAAHRAAIERTAAERGRRPPGRLPQPDHRVERAKAALSAAQAAVDQATKLDKVNVTDPDSRIMNTAKGWLQGYNAQDAVNQHQIVIAYSVTQDANDVAQYQPMVAGTQRMLEMVGVTEPIGLVLVDAGYWSEENATAPGPDRLIATQKDWKQRRAARETGITAGPPPPDSSALEAMEHRLRTKEGAEAYSLRSHTVEPVFSSKERLGFRGFRRRGLSAANSEWAFMNTVHNLGKLRAHQARPPLSSN
jgi:hypothetical protein